jgi:hypothetical protein
MENIKNLNQKMECKNNFRLFVLGNNQDGCLLTGDKIDCMDFKYINVEIPSFKYFNDENDEFTKFKIRTGMNSCGIIDKNSVYIWGILKDDSKKEKIFINNQLSFDHYEFSEQVEDLKIADIHALILCKGKVYSFGSNQHGALGITDENEDNFVSPREISNLPINIKIRKIYTGVRTSFLIDGKKILKI